MLLTKANLIIGNGEYLEHMDLRVQNGVISELGPSLSPKIEETVVDLANHWMLPGLIDTHVHVVMSAQRDPYDLYSKPVSEITIAAVKNARNLLYAGFTTVRDMGACEYVDVAIRNAITQGHIEGPRLKAAGKPLIMTGGHGWFLGGRQADGPDECRKAAREQLFHGADHLKMMATGGGLTKEGEPGLPQLTQEEMTAIVEEAHNAGKKAAAHCHGLQGIRNAVFAGVDSIEHGSFANNSILEEMAKKGVFLCICMRATSLQVSGDAIPAYMMERAKRILGAQLDNCRRAHEMGVKQAFATDAGTPLNPHGENAKEFAFFLQCGFSEMEAIQGATSSAAELLGILDQVGTLEVGKLADILVLNHNPLEDISVLERPEEEINLLLQEGRVIRTSSED